MKQLLRHKAFIKDLRAVQLPDTQAAKLFAYVGKLLEGAPLPPEARDHALQGEWRFARELHLGGDMLLIYQASEAQVTLIRLGSHAQLFKSM